MAFVSLRLSDAINCYYPSFHSEKVIELKKLDKQHTYIVVFGPNKTEVYAAFKKFKGVKILFDGREAINTNYGHGPHPRNKLVVFEIE